MSRPPGLKAAVHDLADVERAIRGLGRADAGRLLSAAVVLIRGFHVEPVPHDHEDLLSEAVTRTLSGERGWRRGMAFVPHLIQVMRSIASDWRRRFVLRAEAGALERREADFLSPAATEDDPEAAYAHPRSGDRDREAAMVAAAKVEEILGVFADDPEVTQVIACLEQEISVSQMQEHTGMSRRRLATAIQRMRRKARRWREVHGP